MLTMMALAGCASSGGSSGGGSPSTLTRAQLLETRQGTLYSAVQTLRPNWLRSRGTTSLSGSSQVVLFLNGAPFGTVSDLNSISIDAVEDIRYMSASEAGARYGTTAGNSGLLLVRTRN
jgi:hypothetical protein